MVSIRKYLGMAAVLAAAVMTTSGSAVAQSYPTKPVKVIASFPPGSAIDIIARTMADALSPGLGQQVVVENRPGAGGTIGAVAVANAAPDGYTVLITSSAFTAAPALYKTMPYNPADIAPVINMAVLPNILVVAPNNDKGIKSVKDLVAYAKANPGKLTYASAGVGSSTHMSDERFRVASGIDAVHVAFKGTPEAMREIVAGRVDYMFTTMASGISFIKNGQLLCLSVGADERSPLLPDVPTTAQAGVPNADYALWAGMFVPAKTPKAVIDRLHQETTKALRTPALQARLATLGASPLFTSTADFEKQIADEIKSVKELTKQAGIEPN